MASWIFGAATSDSPAGRMHKLFHAQTELEQDVCLSSFHWMLAL